MTNLLISFLNIFCIAVANDLTFENGGSNSFGLHEFVLHCCESHYRIAASKLK